MQPKSSTVRELDMYEHFCHGVKPNKSAYDYLAILMNKTLGILLLCFIKHFHTCA